MEIMGLSLAAFFTQLFSIVLMDLVLGGDNAIVIGLACRNLNKNVRMKGVVLGTVGAVVIRVIATILVVWLLKIKFLMAIGGLLLIYIGTKLMIQEEEGTEVEASNSLIRAIVTVIIADATMGIDNVLGVAGAAHGHFGMVVIGLCISIPVMVLGSTLIMKLMDRFPIIIYIGGVIILYTAGGMITDDKSLESFFSEHLFLRWTLIGLITIGGLFFGILLKKKRQRHEKEDEVEIIEE
ncbi:MAG: TerC family protein [Clostridiales Family XIII bacterium]|jgi:YjbE family integral membrane protein|nr:TerC family protein [Clostridiales Family XIII bacterium]